MLPKTRAELICRSGDDETRCRMQQFRICGAVWAEVGKASGIMAW